ncbi:MAG TPA: hypothetical protein VLL54_11970 [Pyrinomonadaceae bacterium]|nr:hypothetical protein [Pyrinomonadaceae bacterium]
MNSLLSPDGLFPQLNLNAQSLFRVVYGVLLLGHLVLLLPHSRRFFMSERWRGYAKSSWDVDVLQNPFAYPFVMATWFLCALLLTFGKWTVWAALVNLLLCRYFFVHMRWKGVLRGMGAPGFMTYWLSAAVLLLEYTTHYAPQLRPLTLLVLQVDFAFIILSAGVYKCTAGFPRNHGMELGLVNPEWGYWWRFYRKQSPNHFVIKLLNHLAWTTEVVAAVFMLIPPMRFIGAALIIVSFFFIATHIRLALLCHMVMLCGVLFFYPGSMGDQLAGMLISAAPVVNAGPVGVINEVLPVLLWAYLFLLPFAFAGIYFNFFARKSLPQPLQRILEVYTNFFGIIMWRVFTIDLINFFPNVYVQPRDGGERALVSLYGWRAGSVRFSHVGESITLTCLFTTLKYYPSNNALFIERLLRYARTVPCPADSILIFEYIFIDKTDSSFEFTTVSEYIVDVSAGTVTERVLNPRVSVHAAHAASPLHEGSRPGSYVPLSS